MGGGPPRYSKENALLSQKSKTKPQTGEVITLRTDEIVKRTSVDIKTEEIVKISVTWTLQFEDEMATFLAKKKSSKLRVDSLSGTGDIGPKVHKKFDEKNGTEYDGDHSELELAEVDQAQTKTLVMAPTSDTMVSADIGEPSEGLPA